MLPFMILSSVKMTGSIIYYLWILMFTKNIADTLLVYLLVSKQHGKFEEAVQLDMVFDKWCLSLWKTSCVIYNSLEVDFMWLLPLVRYISAEIVSFNTDSA